MINKIFRNIDVISFHVLFINLFEMDYKYFSGKIIVTGHTGFKGSWLVTWLSILNAKVMGISIDPSTKPNHYKLIKKYKHS